jgi:TonB family protein
MAGVTVLREQDGWAEIHPQAAELDVRLWVEASALGPVEGIRFSPPPPGSPQPIDMNRLLALRTTGATVSLTPHAAALRAAGIVEAQVGLRMCLAADGAITEAAILEPSGLPAADAAALATVKAWRFQAPKRLVCSRLYYHLSL